MPGFGRAHRAGLIVAFALLAALGFLPQLGGPGYEAALVAGIVLPSVAAIVTALAVRASELGPRAAVSSGATYGVVVAATGFVTVLLHGARVGFCDASEGLLLYVLGPGVGVTLGGVWGALAGLVVRLRFDALRPRRRAALTVVLALSGPLGGVAVSLIRFYTSPMVFAFDPFVGVFSGPLYDTVVDVVDRLWSYRWGSAATLLFVFTAAALAEDGTWREGARSFLRAKLPAVVLAVTALSLSLVHTASGPALGHWNTAQSIAEALGRERHGARCDVVYSASIPERDVRLFTADCDRALPQVESYFGQRGPDRVLVFLFASDQEKGFYMGASRTYIAKPWRGEIYLQAAAYPHPVVAHELAHVVAGAFARGPFRVAGPLAGWFPDPGRIEGFAVAAAADEDGELTPAEWAASMLKLGILPDIGRVFQLDFLSLNASSAYTVAGAFVSFVRDRYGAAAIRAWYGGAALESVTGGKGIAALEADFRRELEKLPVPERALATAKLRFERPAFFSRSCPRIVDRALGLAAQRLGVGDVAGAKQAYAEVLGLDAGNVEARFGLANCARRAEHPGVLNAYRALATDARVPEVLRAGALETSGDIELSRGRLKEAAALYGESLARVFDESRRRTLDVKRYAASDRGREAVLALLVGDAELGPSWDVAAPLIQAWADRDPSDDVPLYLIGRNLLLAGRYREAARYLDGSLAPEPRIPSVRREALRLRIVAGCALSDVPAVERALRAALADPELSRAQRTGLQRTAARCGAKSAP
jgi:tetratricopeptide (TPR) repeat protein